MRDIYEEYGGLFHILFPAPSVPLQSIREQASRTPRPLLRGLNPQKGHVLTTTHRHGFSKTCLVSHGPGDLCSDPRKLSKTKFNLSSDLVYLPISKPL